MNLIIKLSTILLTGFVSLSNAQTSQLGISPNPCVNRTLSTYSIIVADTVSLQIFDVTGKLKVTVLSNVFLSQGLYQDSLILDSLPNGIYLAYLSGKLSAKALAVGKIVKTGITGIIPVKNETEIKIYPNPVNTTLNIENGNSANFLSDLIFYDALGQTVLISKVKAKLQRIDVSFLSPGIYYLRINEKDQGKVIKFIKE